MSPGEKTERRYVVMAGWHGMLAILLFFVAVSTAIVLVIVGLQKNTNVGSEVELTVLLVGGALALVVGVLMLAVVFRRIGMADDKQALGLPQGSIRALIALLLIVLFFIISVFIVGQMSSTTVDRSEGLTAEQVAALPQGRIISIRAVTNNAVTSFNVELARETSAIAEDIARQLVTTVGTLVVSIASFYFGARSISEATRALRGRMLPGQPGNPTAEVGPDGGSAVVSFTPPIGPPPASYLVKSTPDGHSVMGASSPITVTGLSPGDTYTFEVVAHTEDGSGPPARTAAITLRGSSAAVRPGAPSNVEVAAGLAAGDVAVSFTAPDGPEPTGYIVTPSPADAEPVSGSSSPIQVSGLKPGTEYTFEIVAENAAGRGPAVTSEPFITAAERPGAPSNVEVAAGLAAGDVAVSFTAPDGPEPTGYIVTPSPADAEPVSGSSSPIQVRGLKPGTEYTFEIVAENATGRGLAVTSEPFISPS